MSRKSVWTIGIAVVWLAGLSGYALSAADKYDAKVPGGLAMSEFKGYEGWQAISMSRNERVVAITLGNPAMIEAYKAGIPANGQPVPDGAKMAKIHWIPKSNAFFSEITVPGNLLNVDFMEKDSTRFADSGGWGYFNFNHHEPKAPTAQVKPKAECAFCHIASAKKDEVWTQFYPLLDN